jgi:hypothetical protein
MYIVIQNYIVASFEFFLFNYGTGNVILKLGTQKHLPPPPNLFVLDLPFLVS